MKFFRRIIISIALSFLFTTSAFALLPALDEDIHGKMTAAECRDFLDNSVYTLENIQEYMGDQSADDVDLILACGIKSGNIQFWMVPYYIKFALGFLIGIAGLLSVMMILVGAYFYIAGGVSDDKEKGKTIIKFAIGGLIVTSLAWVLVNFLLLLLTA
jgi:hypothetical protein